MCSATIKYHTFTNAADVCQSLKFSRFMQIYLRAEFELKKTIHVSFGFRERESRKEKDHCVCYLLQYRGDFCESVAESH